MGMDDEHVEMLMAGHSVTPSSLHKFGLDNVRDRMSLCYGDTGAFHIFSVKGSFTCVELLLPQEKMEGI